MKAEQDGRDEQDRQWAWLCEAMPAEAYRQDPDRFWEAFQKIAPHVSREDMERALKASE
jgi:hypothetical protein